jgi:hypothetical protein
MANTVSITTEPASSVAQLRRGETTDHRPISALRSAYFSTTLRRGARPIARAVRM